MTARERKSKKRSDASSFSKPPEPVVLFLDENLSSRQIIDALRALEVRVEISRDHFPAGTPDEEWLAKVGEKGWIVLTRDSRIRYREPEKQALIHARAKAFVLATNTALTGEEMARSFSAALPKILRLAKNHPPPFIAKVTRSGSVEMIYAHKAKRRQK